MKEYTVTADVIVSVEMTIKANSAAEAREMFRDHIMMTAGLADVPDELYDVAEDSISDLENVEVSISGK